MHCQKCLEVAKFQWVTLTIIIQANHYDIEAKRTE